MDSDLTLVTALLQNPLLTLDEARRDADAAGRAAEPTARRKTPRELAADRFARTLDCCG
jgi:hypothetical protein